MKLTLSQIKEINQENGNHFFDRNTLKGFGETMKSFKVQYIDGINYVIRKRDNKTWKFNPANGTLNIPYLALTDEEIFGKTKQ